MTAEETLRKYFGVILQEQCCDCQNCIFENERCDIENDELFEKWKANDYQLEVR